jgi:hypothetical protein
LQWLSPFPPPRHDRQPSILELGLNGAISGLPNDS